MSIAFVCCKEPRNGSITPKRFPWQPKSLFSPYPCPKSAESGSRSRGQVSGVKDRLVQPFQHNMPRSKTRLSSKDVYCLCCGVLQGNKGFHEFHETCHSVTFYFLKKYPKRYCDTTTPESIHTKDESKCGSAFAFIFGVK